MKRILEFEKFRNIGIQTTQNLVLNHSLEKGKMGNLVIVIGANNSGKSNVLDALLEFSDRALTDKDVTTLRLNDKDRIPSLTLKIKDDSETYSYKIEYGNSPKISYFENKTYSFSQKKKAIKELLDIIVDGFRECGMSDDVQAYQQIELLEKATKEDELQPIIKAVSNIIDVLESRSGRYGMNYKTLADRISECYIKNLYLFPSVIQSKRTCKDVQNRFLNKYGISFIPQIYPYTEKVLTNRDLEVLPSQISGNQFFKAVFSAIKVDIAEVTNAYKDFTKLQNSKSILTTFERSINKKLKSIAKKFNDLYVLDDGTYEFKLSFESQRIFFEIFRDDHGLSLDYQSTGFKWFFNLYFNLLCTNSLNSGDIVVMDEPATNLHVYGQQELRSFLKSFAKENDITIVLATHSPFLIDMDYLDELRVISMLDNESQICNDFSTIDLDDPDSLSPIKEALTVRNHVLYDPDNKVVFVEGITDYNYMVAFKKRFKIENIVFLPIKGIGEYGSPEFKQKQKTISKRLIRIKKNSPILMVDSDSAGKSIKSINSADSALQVFTLADVNPNFKAIESVFCQTDLNRLGIEVNGSIKKHSSTSALLKTFSFDTKLSVETERNFKSIFDYIEKL